MRGLWASIFTAVMLTSAANAPAALAADTYVNRQTGDDGNTCTAVATPCASIGQGITQAGAGDTVFVQAPSGGPVTYSETVTLGDGKSLVSQASDPSQTVLNAGFLGQLGAPLLSLSSDAGSVSGFDLEGPADSADLAHTVTLEHDVIGRNAQPSHAEVYVTGGSPVLRNDTFIDPAPSTPSAGKTAVLIEPASGTAPQVLDSSFTGFRTSIAVNAPGAGIAGAPAINGNTIEVNDEAAAQGVGIAVSDAAPEIADNVISASARHLGGSPPTGVQLMEGADAETDTGATMRRNRLENLPLGVLAQDTLGPVTLNGDVLHSAPLFMRDTGSGGGDVTATNVTMDSQGDVANDGAHLTLDSSLLANFPGVVGSGTCTITYSRGPEMADQANGCKGFQTTADPGFADEANGDLHLLATSAMIDAGNPSAPAAGDVDRDGDPRALAGPASGHCEAAAVRDIGADEFNCPPEAVITKGPHSHIDAHHARFKFVDATDPASTFACALGSKPLKPCVSPLKLTRLGSGVHLFHVSATDPQGNVSPPVTWKFKVVG